MRGFSLFSVRVYFYFVLLQSGFCFRNRSGLVGPALSVYVSPGLSRSDVLCSWQQGLTDLVGDSSRYEPAVDVFKEQFCGGY